MVVEEEEDEVESARGSTTRLGVAISATEFITPIAARGIRGPNLTRLSPRFSILAVAEYTLRRGVSIVGQSVGAVKQLAASSSSIRRQREGATGFGAKIASEGIDAGRLIVDRRFVVSDGAPPQYGLIGY